MRKPHAASKLKTLPPARQEAIWDYMQGHTLAETRAWLATPRSDASVIETNATSLSEFWAWYPVASRLQEAKSLADQVKAELRQMPGLKLDDEQLSQAGQAIFETAAIKQQDSKLYVALRNLRQTDRALAAKEKGFRLKYEQKERELALTERRIAVLEANANKAKEQLAKLKETSGGLSPEAKSEIERIAKIL